jgi:hypothetical protein
MKLGRTAKWVLALTAVGYLGAAFFYSPYIGLNAQVAIECPLCPHVLSFGDPVTKFFRYTLVGGVLNSAMLFLLAGIIRLLVAAWRQLRTYWT